MLPWLQTVGLGASKAKSAVAKAPQPLGGKGKPAGGLSALAPRTPVNKPKPSGVCACHSCHLEWYHSSGSRLQPNVLLSVRWVGTAQASTVEETVDAIDQHCRPVDEDPRPVFVQVEM